MFEDLQNLGVLKKEGYRINLKNIAKEDLNLIKKQLTLVPKVHKDFVKNVIKYKCFSINKKYIYLPKYWALEKIGEPKKNLLKRGEYFNKKLETIYPPRPFQVEIIDKTYKQLKEIGGGIITVSCGQGKCLGEDTPILMYDGKIKMVQDVKVGDKLMGDDSTPRNVLSLARGREMMYKIIPKRGNSYIVNESHILSLKCSTKCRFGKKNDVFDIPLKDYLKLPKSYLGKGSSICGYKVPVEFQEKEVDMDPYIIGLWLGDGTSSSSGFTTNNHQMIHYLHKNLPKYDMYLEYSGRQYDYRITNDYSKTKGRNLFNKILKKYNLFKNKHIPDIYKCNSRKNRLKILAGLLDTDGSLESNTYYI